ncbi:hypothetical protein NDR86_08285 [Nocardia sp. CDC141]|uniref:Uncharacterized protein n=1 Tax=Nocardia pulmonis TaxID=2951408 RepID=A0A9X2IX50_9NOCA|nr:hypothetical protein [Nocardia pulmonis]
MLSERERLGFVEGMLRAVAQPRRIAAVVERMVGGCVEVGPVGVGPGGLGSVSMVGIPGAVQVGPVDGDLSELRVGVPVRVVLELGVAGTRTRFLGAAWVQTRVRLVPEPPCALVVRVAPVAARLPIRIAAPNPAAGLLGSVFGVDRVAAQLLRERINAALTGAGSMAVRRIDLVSLLDGGWAAHLAAGVA